MVEEEKLDEVHEERSRMSGGEIDKGKYVRIYIYIYKWHLSVKYVDDVENEHAVGDGGNDKKVDENSTENDDKEVDENSRARNNDDKEVDENSKDNDGKVVQGTCWFFSLMDNSYIATTFIYSTNQLKFSSIIGCVKITFCTTFLSM